MRIKKRKAWTVETSTDGDENLTIDLAWPYIESANILEKEFSVG